MQVDAASGVTYFEKYFHLKQYGAIALKNRNKQIEGVWNLRGNLLADGIGVVAPLVVTLFDFTGNLGFEGGQGFDELTALLFVVEETPATAKEVGQFGRRGPSIAIDTDSLRKSSMI